MNGGICMKKQLNKTNTFLNAERATTHLQMHKALRGDFGMHIPEHEPKIPTDRMHSLSVGVDSISTRE